MDIGPKKQPPVPAKDSSPSDRESPIEGEELPGQHSGISVKSASVPKKQLDPLSSAPPSVPITSRTIRKDSVNESLAATDADSACAILKNLFERCDIPFDPSCKKYLLSAKKTMPTNEEALQKWIGTDTDRARISLFCGTLMMKSPVEVVREAGERNIKAAFVNFPEECSDQVNFWRARTLLKEKTLTSHEETFIQQSIDRARMQELKFGDRVNNLFNMGTLANLPFGALPDAIKYISEMDIDLIKCAGETVKDPLIFDFFDTFPTGLKKVDLDYLEDLELSDPRCINQLVPEIIATSSAACRYLYELRDKMNNFINISHNEDIKQLVKTLYSVYFYDEKIFNSRIDDRHRAITSFLKWLKESDSDSDSDSDSVQDKMVEFQEKIKTISRGKINHASRRLFIKANQQLTELENSLQDNESFNGRKIRAFLLTHIGSIYEKCYIKSGNPVTTACEYYIKACELMPSKPFAENIARILEIDKQYNKAADFLLNIAPKMSDPGCFDDNVIYNLENAEIHRYYPDNLSDQEINLHDYGFDEPKPELTKNQKKKSKKRLRKKAGMQSTTTSIASKKIESNGSDVKVGPTPETSDPTAVNSVSEPAMAQPKFEKITGSMSHQKTILPFSPRQLLPKYWHKRVFNCRRAAIICREECKDYQQEKAILEKGIKKLSGYSGVERLHEELAWNLIHHQRDSLSVSKTPEGLKAESIKILNKAENHLIICLGKKLNKTPEEAKSLFKNNGWREVASTIRNNLPDRDDQESYSNGIRCIMSSLGHVYSELGHYVSADKIKEIEQGGYSGKTF